MTFKVPFFDLHKTFFDIQGTLPRSTEDLPRYPSGQNKVPCCVFEGLKISKHLYKDEIHL
jgi:hypothetical protein